MRKIKRIVNRALIFMLMIFLYENPVYALRPPLQCSLVREVRKFINNTEIEASWSIKGQHKELVPAEVDFYPMHDPNILITENFLQKGSVLGVGCEAGVQETILALEGFYPVVGIDIISNLIDEARKRREDLYNPEEASIFKVASSDREEYSYVCRSFNPSSVFTSEGPYTITRDSYRAYTPEEIKRARTNLYFLPGMFAGSEKFSNYGKTRRSKRGLLRNFGKFDNIITANSYKYIDPVSLLAEANNMLVKDGRFVIISTEYGHTYHSGLDYCFILLNKTVGFPVKGIWKRYSFDLTEISSNKPSCLVSFEDLARASGFETSKKYINPEDLTTYYLLEKREEYNAKEIKKLYKNRLLRGENAFLEFTERRLDLYIKRMEKIQHLTKAYSFYYSYDLGEEIKIAKEALRQVRSESIDQGFEEYQKIAEYIEVVIKNYLECVKREGLSYRLGCRIEKGRDSIWDIFDYVFGDGPKLKEGFKREYGPSLSIGTALAYMDLGNICAQNWQMQNAIEHYKNAIEMGNKISAIDKQKAAIIEEMIEYSKIAIERIGIGITFKSENRTNL